MSQKTLSKFEITTDVQEYFSYVHGHLPMFCAKMNIFNWAEKIPRQPLLAKFLH